MVPSLTASLEHPSVEGSSARESPVLAVHGHERRPAVKNASLLLFTYLQSRIAILLETNI